MITLRNGIGRMRYADKVKCNYFFYCWFFAVCVQPLTKDNINYRNRQNEITLLLFKTVVKKCKIGAIILMWLIINSTLGLRKRQ